MKKKILFVINTMGRAGAEKCLLSMLGHMNDKEYEISLFSVINMGEMFDFVPKHVKILNENPCTDSVIDNKAQARLRKEIIHKGFKNAYFFKNIMYFTKMLFHQVKRGRINFKHLFFKLLSDTQEKQTDEYDLAVAYIQGAATYYVMDHVKAKKKIAFLHNEFLESGYCPSLEKRFYEKADRIYCVSGSIAKHFVQVFPFCVDKTEVFYNLIDKDEIERKAYGGDRNKLLLPRQDQELVLLTAARLTPVKAYDLAVPALAKARKEGCQVRWYVLGEGTERENIEGLIKKYELEKYFILLGETDNPYPYIAECDVYVQATRYEGCATSISEAVILKKPVLASNCDGNKEQLSRYNTGLLVDLTVDSIAEGIHKMADSKQFRKKLIQEADLQAIDPKMAVQRIYEQAEEGEADEKN